MARALPEGDNAGRTWAMVEGFPLEIGPRGTMGLFDGFVRRSPPASRGSGDLSAHRPFLDSIGRPAIRLVATDWPGFSRLGGLPDLPAHVAWPVWKGRPQSFLAQLDLAAIPGDLETGPLPRTGILSFFYDAEGGTWGFDPKDRGSFTVVYLATADGTTRMDAPPSMPPEGVFREVPLAFAGALTYPPWEDDRVRALGLDDAQGDAYLDLCESVFAGRPAHQLLGHPAPVQANDMDLECQLVTHGLYCGDATGYTPAERAALEPGRSDWLLLLQIDSDDDAGMMWGDGGRLYFWIRKQDLERRDFSGVWMILQCG